VFGWTTQKFPFEVKTTKRQQDAVVLPQVVPAGEKTVEPPPFHVEFTHERLGTLELIINAISSALGGQALTFLAKCNKRE